MRCVIFICFKVFTLDMKEHRVKMQLLSSRCLDLVGMVCVHMIKCVVKVVIMSTS